MKVAANRPWFSEAVDELIDQKESGETLDFMAAHHGRTRNAIEQKLSELRRLELLPPADLDRIATRPNQDALHVIACLAQGGFPALSERSDGRFRKPDTRGSKAGDNWHNRNAAERAAHSDAEHAETALGEGGFPALNETQGAKGHRSVCLPLIYPTRL